MLLPIESERLLVRVYEPGDVSRLHAELYGDPAVRRWTGGPSTLDETRAVVAAYIDAHERNGYAYWAVIERESGDLVGEAGLKPLDDVGPEIELGYAFRQASWGRGYATEVARAVLDRAFGQLELDRVYATARAENTGSRHVLEKLGFAAAPTLAGGHNGLVYHVLERR
jgi:[ribosomal protein S5]-alanine N-acetyltransferase